jgi:hypothetical protein
MKPKMIVFFVLFQIMELRWNETDRGKSKYSEKTLPIATSLATNPTWTDPGSKPGFHGARPAANGLSRGMAQVFTVYGKQKNPRAQFLYGKCYKWNRPDI